MTATVPAARKSKARTLRVHWAATPLDRTAVSLTVFEGRRSDAYHCFHAADSCEVEWRHDDTPERSYTVVCSAATGRPVRCSCPHYGFRGVQCRHMAASAVLIARGELTVPRLADAGHDRGTTE